MRRLTARRFPPPPPPPAVRSAPAPRLRSWRGCAGRPGRSARGGTGVPLGDRFGRRPRTGGGSGVGGDGGRIVGCRGVAVDEVEGGVRGDAVEQPVPGRSVPGEGEVVPSDVREQGGAGQPPRRASLQAEAGGAVLLAGVVEQLQPHADTQERPSPGPEGFHQAGLGEAGHGGAGGTHPGEHQGVRAVQAAGVGRHVDPGSGPFQPLADRHQVAGAVVDDRDQGRGGHVSLTAARSARGRDLKAASDLPSSDGVSATT